MSVQLCLLDLQDEYEASIYTKRPAMLASQV